MIKVQKKPADQGCFRRIYRICAGRTKKQDEIGEIPLAIFLKGTLSGHADWIYECIMKPNRVYLVPSAKVMYIDDLWKTHNAGGSMMGYELKSARYLARDVLMQVLQPGDAAVDATMGNGHDTQFLCELVGPGGRVYAFDIQEQALARTEERLREAGLADRAELFRVGHENMAGRVSGPVSAVVFNLGWLPGGDHRVTTRWETTRAALAAGLELLCPLGVLTVCVYPGHAEGERERGELLSFAAGLSNRRFSVLRQSFPNAGPGAPECLVIQKLRGKTPPDGK